MAPGGEEQSNGRSWTITFQLTVHVLASILFFSSSLWIRPSFYFWISRPKKLNLLVNLREQQWVLFRLNIPPFLTATHSCFQSPFNQQMGNQVGNDGLEGVGLTKHLCLVHEENRWRNDLPRYGERHQWSAELCS